ncbi:alpha/beta fold hydrolase [Wenxinia saemankumensis]|uniref:Pimeloyl-ACP methyl ester carboxylesterase n=1 Tax=Wenxinia saemankumensis TaxID=1447782 RepID=A0A1M6ETU5_9RHOB|nr:alpha/beta fold hydrolase [Wenxinia saemankumensis]SHI88790.1 Pimeloyl-ACP methyl ester carboxylesterase [Wenxinia saemankumensis]
MELNIVTAEGTGPARPLLVAHGLFGSARNWGVIARRMSDRGPVHAVDMRNHGASPRADSQGYDDMAGDLADTIEALGAGPVDLLGHSMGGKAAMVLALTRPDLVARLIVADIAPVAYGHSQSHLIEAMRQVPLDVPSRAEARAALPVADEGVAAFLLQSFDRGAGQGGGRWLLNLDVLEAEMTRITGFPQMDGRWDGPTLFVTGGASDYVGERRHDPCRALFPQAEFRRIEGAGHWLHAEKPREFEAALRDWLDGDGSVG